MTHIDYNAADPKSVASARRIMGERRLEDYTVELRKRVEVLEREVADLERENDDLEDEIVCLHEKIEEGRT